MAFLKFNRKELVNLEYSLRREILSSNRNGAYMNTTIISCNTRKYHGLLVTPSENNPSEKFVLLSSLDESIILSGQHFNLGIHCYGDIYEPKGHKYIVDFEAETVPTLTYKVGPVVLKKSTDLDRTENRAFVKYSLVESPAPIDLELRPMLAFRNIHALTQENPDADTSCIGAENGVAFHLYHGLPTLYLQTNVKSEYCSLPYWYKGVTYSNEYRRGFDCREDLFSPGCFRLRMKPGDEIVLCAAVSEQNPRTIKANYRKIEESVPKVNGHHDMLLSNVERFKEIVSGRKMITAGFSWLDTGLLRESIETLAGLTIYATGNKAEFEEILDNLIEAESERLFHRTTQIEAPLALTDTLQQYIEFGAKPAAVWKKYGPVLKKIIESYAGPREEVSLCPNGLLWAQKYRTALTWMNTYVNGIPVNERGGFQVETNALWYNALCFALEMEKKYSKGQTEFLQRFTPIRDLVKQNFQSVFLITSRTGYYSLADYVDNEGQHGECRPNMLWAVYIPYPLVSEDVQADIVAKINNELVTRRGIRSLSPRSEIYKGVYEGSQIDRDLAYYNGCSRASLLGPWEAVCFRMMGSSFCKKAKWLTEGFFEDAGKHGVGAFSELYDGDPPHEPHGAIASACATAALMRCIYLMDKYSEEEAK